MRIYVYWEEHPIVSYVVDHRDVVYHKVPFVFVPFATWTFSERARGLIIIFVAFNVMQFYCKIELIFFNAMDAQSYS